MSVAAEVDTFAKYLATLEPDEFTRVLAQAKVKAAPAVPDDKLPTGAANGVTARLVPFNAIDAKRTDWLWQGRIPRGMLALLIGTEGLGKSAATLRLAALASRGALPGDFGGNPSDVALVTVEDDPNRTMRPRLEAAGADLHRVHHLRLSMTGQDAHFTLPRDAGLLGRTLGEAGVRLVIIDPLAAALDPRLNSYKDTDVREALTPLVTAAEEHDFAVLGVLHTNKTNTTDARSRAMGSVGWRQIVRSALYLSVDPDDPDGKTGPNRVIAHDKCNVGPLARSLRLALTTATVKVEGKPAAYPRAELGEECDHRASDLLAAEAEVNREKIGGKAAEASALLYRELASGPKAVSALEAAAAAAGVSWRTVEEAKKVIGVTSKRAGGAWVWDLAETGLPVG